MEDKVFFEKVLGLNESWKVQDIHLDMEELKVKVVLDSIVKRGQWEDSSGTKAQVQSYEVRQWRHMDTMQLETIIEARVPRLLKKDGSTEMVKVPWADSSSRWTLMFEAWCVKILGVASDIEKARGLLRLSWDSVQRVMSRAVERGMQRRQLTELEVVGVDEKSFKKGQSYVSALHDIEQGRVLEVIEGADAKAVENLWKLLPAEVLEGIRVAVMDMAATMQKGTKEVIPKAQICFDRFHVDKHVVDAVDQVRRKENEELIKQGDDTLKNTRYYWLFNPENMKSWQKDRFDKLVNLDLFTAQAWAMKELWTRFWDQPDEESARFHFESWYDHVMEKSMEPIKKVARMIKTHFDGIIAAFNHKVNNATAEGLNSKIQSLKYAARGFRNFDNYRIRILFYCGKLDLLSDL